jgi:putative cardiolipin synthase
MKSIKKRYYILSLGLLLALIALDIVLSYAPRPMASDYQRTPSYAITTTETTPLAQAIAADAAAHPGQSGVVLINKGEDALFKRLALIASAQKTLDIQSYMVDDDNTGKLVLESILEAADRGVRVRVLIDDLNIRGRDHIWALLNAHANIEMRIFNPFATHDESIATRIADAVSRLGHFNKRMHNKSMIVDNRVAIAGGRNMGDVYFDASSDFNFHDLDVLLAGPVAGKLSQSFDKYWNAPEAFPLTLLLPPRDSEKEVAIMRATLKQHWQDELHRRTSVQIVPMASQLGQGSLQLIWADVELAADSPTKIDTPKQDVESKPAAALDDIAATAQKEFIIVSPYFVPGQQGEEGIRNIIKRGAKVKVLTNSLASTDAAAPHIGYRAYRQQLVQDGVSLYEMKPVSGQRHRSHRFSSSSRSSLHAKIYIVDRRDLMIGSFNLDPRSVNLNTEMVLTIHSPQLAEQVIGIFDNAIAPASSFHIVIHNGQLEWITEDNGKQRVYTSEPEAGFLRSIEAAFLGLFPIQGEL